MKISDLNVPLPEFAGDDRAVRFVSITEDQARKILASFGPGDSAVAVVALKPNADGTARVPGVVNQGATRGQAVLFRPLQDNADGTIVALMIAPTELELD